jgi:cytochrome c oxidase subunit 2
VQRLWSVYFGLILVLELGLYLAARFFIPGWGLPHLANSDSFGANIDRLFYVIEGPVGFFFILTQVILVWGMWRFAGSPERRAVYTHGDHRLEMAWTAVPALILLFIAFVQISAWEDIKYHTRMKPPQHVIEVSARQFAWMLRYPGGKLKEKLKDQSGPPEMDPEHIDRKKFTVDRESDSDEWEGKRKAADNWGRHNTGEITDLHVVNEVHTWAGANTRIYLKSRDVLHSFFLPHMRLKQDAVPGKDFIPVWFKPTDYNGEWDENQNVWVYAKDKDGKKKVWELACAELCGWGHYKMNGFLYVHKNEDNYDKWLAHALEAQRTKTRPKEKK